MDQNSNAAEYLQIYPERRLGGRILHSTLRGFLTASECLNADLRQWKMASKGPDDELTR